LFWSINKGFDCEALIIDYGQRHRIEIEAAKKIAAVAQVPFQVIQTDLFKQIGDSALIGSGDISQNHRVGDLPASFVPGRNILFLTIAGAVAFKKGAVNIVTGVCQTDYSGYPDCRDNTLRSVNLTLNLGMDYPFMIYTPMMWLSKKEEVELALTLPGCMEALVFSHTCYEGQFPPCEVCPACILRAKGFREAGVIDPLLKALSGVNV
jgi:7-cyano-7-deazaguanine synthase